MQHLPYSSRPWCYWQLLWSCSLLQSSTVKELSMIIVLVYIPTKINNSNATSSSAVASQLWPPCLYNPQQKYIDYLKSNQNKHSPNHPRFRRRTAHSTACQLLPIPRIYDNHRTTHVFVSGPYVVRLTDYFSLPEYVNQAGVIFND